MALSVTARRGAVAAAFTVAMAVVPSAALADPVSNGSTPAPSVPSAADVSAAQAAAAAAAQEVADITAQVQAAEARLEALQKGVAEAVAAHELAQQQLAAAQTAVQQATADLAAAQQTRQEADRTVSATAAEMYMQGSDLQNLTTLLLSPPNTMTDLGVVLDDTATRVTDSLDAATSASVQATAKQRVLASVQATRDGLAADAAAKRADAEKAAADAGAEAAKLGKQQEALTARLDQLKQGVADLINQREAAARLGNVGMLGLQAAAGAPRAAQDIARSMMASYGWDATEFTCLVALWNGESGWSWSAANPSSGAYGIPQALPGWKMASAGSDWLTNPATQITWGLGYIRSTYGSPCKTYSTWLSRSPHWY